MLMELRSGWTAKKFAEDRGLSQDNITVLASLFFDDYWSEMEDDEDYDYLGAIKACLDGTFGIENNRLISLEELRSHMLKRIVSPLYKALRHYCLSDKDLERALEDEDATLTDHGSDTELLSDSPAEVDNEARSITEGMGGSFIKRWAFKLSTRRLY